MKPQKIAYLIFRTRENTGTHVVFDQMRALQKRGDHVTVYSLFGNSASWYPKGITTQNIIKYPFRKPPEALIATFWPTAYLATFLPARKKFYLVMGWEEAFHTNPVVKFFAKNSYKLPLRKIAVSKFLKDKLKHFTSSHIFVIPTYIARDLFPKHIRKGKRSQVQILSVVSWYNPVKGPDLLDKAVRYLKKQHSYRFVLVSREKQPYSDVFDAFYTSPNRKNLQNLYQESDILLSTSRSEGFYIPGIEAMANGCMFVSTNSGGIGEYAKDGDNAVILNNFSDLWKKDILKKTLRSRERLRKNGFKTAAVYKKYSLDNLGRDLERMLIST